MDNALVRRKEKKIISGYNKLAEMISAHKVLGKKIIFLSGTFDMFHIGHCRYFLSAIEAVAEKTSKGREDIVLVVGVDSDDEVRMRKGPYRPVVSQDERAEVVAYDEDVDYVIIKEEKEFNWNLAQTIRADFIILSESTNVIYEGGREKMIEDIKEWAEDVFVLPPQAETSTTGRIHKLITEKLADARVRINSIFDELLGGKQ
ncbi:MAG: adenylyltransferase/cytidyltransferase family protein [Parcubacteria group bacterium]